MGIDLGSAAINRNTTMGLGNTRILLDNPAGSDGVITSVEIWMDAPPDSYNVLVGTFYGTPPSFTCRDYANIGHIENAAKRTVSGLSIEAQSGDYLGVYCATFGAVIEASDSGGSGVYHKAGNQMESGEQTYSLLSDYDISLYATGYIVKTGVAAIGASAALSIGGNMIGEGVSAIAASGSLSPAAGLIRQGGATLQAVSALSALVTRLLPVATAAILASASVSVVGQKQKPVAAALNAVAALAADGDLIASGVASIQIIAAVQALGHAIWSGQCDVNAVVSILADRIGHEFAEIAIAAVASMAAAPVVIRDGVVTISATSELELVGLAYWTTALGYSGTLTPGDKLVIDTDAMTVKLNRADARANFTGKFWQLWPGNNEITWIDNDGSRNVTAAFEHEPRWL